MKYIQLQLGFNQVVIGVLKRCRAGEKAQSVSSAGTALPFALGLWPDSTGDLLAALISKVSELKNIALPTGFEPVTTAFGGRRHCVLISGLNRPKTGKSNTYFD